MDEKCRACGSVDPELIYNVSEGLFREATGTAGGAGIYCRTCFSSLFKKARGKYIPIRCTATLGDDGSAVRIVESAAVPFIRLREAIAEQFDIVFSPDTPDLIVYRALFPHPWRGIRMAYHGKDFELRRAGMRLTFAVDRLEMNRGRVLEVAEWTKEQYRDWDVEIIILP